MQLKARASFFHQLAAMLDAGLSLQHSLTLAGKDCAPAVQQSLQQISQAVGAGQALATGMGRYPQEFDAWTVSLIRMAEYSGALGAVCRRLAIAAEQTIRRRRLYQSVAIAGLSTILSVLFLVAVLIPAILPILVGLLVVLGSIAIATQLVRDRQVSRQLQRFWMGFPVLGEMIRVRMILYFTELALPLACGVSVLTAMDLLEKHLPDPELGAILHEAGRRVRGGQALSTAIAGRLPAIAVQMVRTGEETGDLEGLIAKLAKHYEGDLERILVRLQSVLRPLSIVVAGGVVVIIGIQMIGGMVSRLPG